MTVKAENIVAFGLGRRSPQSLSEKLERKKNFRWLRLTYR